MSFLRLKGKMLSWVLLRRKMEAFYVLSPSFLFFVYLLFMQSPNLGIKFVESQSALNSTTVLHSGNSSIYSENSTFELGFFSNGNSNWYLGIKYASMPTPIYVWVANREAPARNATALRLELAQDGYLSIMDGLDLEVWRSSNAEKSCEVKLLESGNLVLFSCDENILWQSFDFPTDTWLPGMNMSVNQSLISWKSASDPSPGVYMLRLRRSNYGELELVYNNSLSYWSTGRWTGNAFLGVPEMTVTYIYRFHFIDPFTPMVSFGFTVVSLDAALHPPITRFHLDSGGQLKQHTWSSQIDNWNTFWTQPENRCKAYGLCGNLGLCDTGALTPCQCLNGFKPVDYSGWKGGDFSAGCQHQSGERCTHNDVLKEVGNVRLDGAVSVSFPGSQNLCEETCLRNCSCVGMHHNGRNNMCTNLYGSLLNLQNLTGDSTEDVIIFYVKVEKQMKKTNVKIMALTVTTIILLALFVVSVILIYLLRKRMHNRNQKDDSAIPVTTLMVFSYKDLSAATQGFSEKLGHGGFGTVFKGELHDSSLVAVKRLERPGGGEREFRAEVCTIGNIQHVNLVRLRGFCSENSHRLLVYDYMENGSLNMYLRPNGPTLSWDVRYRIAIATARGIAYLHEECRDCIIHCDIKPENILLDSDFTPRVSDFGLAKLVGRDFSRVLVTMRGTWGYVAPEWISGVAITTKADVYSYGMTLLELIGGRRNVEGGPQSAGGAPVVAVGAGDQKWFFPPYAAHQIIEGNFIAIVDRRLGSAYNSSEAERIGLVAVWCIQDDEEMRPTMSTVVKMLEGIVEVAKPPPPKLLQALVSGDSFHRVRDSTAGKMANGSYSGESTGVSSQTPSFEEDVSRLS